MSRASPQPPAVATAARERPTLPDAIKELRESAHAVVLNARGRNPGSVYMINRDVYLRFSAAERRCWLLNAAAPAPPGGPPDAGWRDISTAPKSGDWFKADVWAVLEGENDEPAGYRYTDATLRDSEWYDNGGNQLNWTYTDSAGEKRTRRVTHWMPLPLAPGQPPPPPEQREDEAWALIRRMARRDLPGLCYPAASDCIEDYDEARRLAADSRLAGRRSEPSTEACASG